MHTCIPSHGLACLRRVNAGNKSTLSMHHPQDGMRLSKWLDWKQYPVTYTKTSLKMANPRYVARSAEEEEEDRRRRKRRRRGRMPDSILVKQGLIITLVENQRVRTHSKQLTVEETMQTKYLGDKTVQGFVSGFQFPGHAGQPALL